MSVPEWGVVEKRSDPADLKVIVKERVPGKCPKMPIPNQPDCCLSSVSRSAKKGVKIVSDENSYEFFCYFWSNQTVTGKARLEIRCYEILRLEDE